MANANRRDRRRLNPRARSNEKSRRIDNAPPERNRAICDRVGPTAGRLPGIKTRPRLTIGLGRRSLVLVLAALLAVTATGGILASGLLGGPAAPGLLSRFAAPKNHTTAGAAPGRSRALAPQSAPSPGNPSKEYIYVGSRLVSTDESGASATAGPTITSVAPDSANVGDQATIRIFGSDLQGATAVQFDTGLIGAQITGTPSANEVDASVTVNTIAPAGSHSVQVISGPAQSNQFPFTVNAEGSPVLNSMSIANGQPGQSFSVTLSGRGLSSVNALNFAPQGFTAAGSITASGITAQSDSVLAANISISSNETPGNYLVTATNAAGQSSAGLLFVVNQPNPPNTLPPVITGISPGSATATFDSSSTTVTITGQNLVSGSQATVVYVDDQIQSGVTFNSQTNPTQLSFSVGIGSAWLYSIFLQNPGTNILVSSTVTFTVNNPVPVLTSITPSAVAAGSGQVSITVNGSNFVPGNGSATVVKLAGATVTTLDNSPTQLIAQIPASSIGNPGSVVNMPITVFSGGPGGGASAASVNLSVIPPPALASISPQSVTAGTGPFTLTVNGSNFRSTDVVKATANGITTTLANAGTLTSSQITATVPASVIAQGGPITITVTDTGVAGGNSGPLTLTANNPIPQISGLSPATVIQGSTPGTLTINGAGFVPTSKVSINGANQATVTFVSGSQITTQLTAAELQTATNLPVTVTNPLPGGGPSNPASLQVIPPAPNAPTNLTATAVSSSQINLSWTDNSPTNETAFVIQRKTGSGGTFATIDTTPAHVTTFADTTVTAGTAYYYQVQATNNGSLSKFTNQFQATAYAAAPSALTALATSTVSASQINLTWNDSNTTETGIKVERGAAQSGPFSQIAVLCPDTTSYSDTGLAGGTTYYYRLRSSNSQGDSAYTSVVPGKTQSSQPPAAPSNLSAFAEAGLQISLNWFSNSTNQTGFLITQQVGNTTTQISVGPSVTSYTVTGLQPNTQYCYYVQAVNSAGSSATSNTACATTGSSLLRLPPPQDSSRLLDRLIALAATGNGGPGAIRAGDPMALWLNGVYFDALGLGGPMPSGPAAPAGLVAWPVSGTQINLSWAPGDSTQTGFILQRATSASGPFTTIANIQCASMFTYADTGLTTGTTYYYQVVATSSGGSSANSNTASATAPATPTISNISPSYILVGTAPLVVTINGSNFVSGSNASVINVNGQARPTTFVNASQLTTQLAFSDLASVAGLSITVVNPNPTLTSNAVTLNVVANNQPTITSLSPSSATAGSAAFTLTVNGANYVSASVVEVNGSNRATTFVGPGQLGAAIPASDVASVGSLNITVANPSPGSTSTATALPVVQPNYPVPAITSISPASVTAGSAGFNLTVNGSGFVNNVSVVRVNGGNRTTTFVSGGQLTGAIAASDIASAGSLSITVFNPTPGGGTSNTKTLTVNPATPPAPTNLTLQAIPGSGINLSWSYSGPAITGFQIFRGNGNGFPPTPTFTVSAGTTFFSDTTVTSGNTYCYKVEAYNSAGNSPDSNQPCVNF